MPVSAVLALEIKTLKHRSAQPKPFLVIPTLGRHSNIHSFLQYPAIPAVPRHSRPCPRHSRLFPVIPAQAGIQKVLSTAGCWIPACAGMTSAGGDDEREGGNPGGAHLTLSKAIQRRSRPRRQTPASGGHRATALHPRPRR